MRFSDIKAVAFDFDGVFTDNRVYVREDGTETVACSRADGLGLAKLKRLHIPLVVVSTETNPVVGARCTKLGIDSLQGISDKAEALLSLCRDWGLSTEDIAFVGNDENDLTALKLAGFPISVNDAYPSVKALCKYVTNRSGGYGAVREICELIYNSYNSAAKKI